MPKDPRKRRKRARIETNSDWSESESDSANEPTVQHTETAPQISDHEMESDSSEASEFEPATAPKSARERLAEQPKSTDQTKPSEPEDQNKQYHQAFLKLITQQFGDDLEALRAASDFGPSSLDQLVAGLKQGINIFDERQRQIIAQNQ